MKLCSLILLTLFFSCSFNWKEIPSNNSLIGQSIIYDRLYLNKIDSAKTILKNAMNVQNLPSISFSIGINGKLIWSKAIGYKDIETKSPVTIHSTYRIGSISKSVTSLALGLLYQENKLNFDSSIYHYLPDFPKKEHDIKVKHLVS